MARAHGRPARRLRPTEGEGLARFGWLLGLIGVSVVFSMAAPDATWGEGVALLLQAGVLLLAVHAVEAPSRLQRVAAATTVAAVAIGGAGLLLDTSEGSPVGAAVVATLGMVLVAAAIAAIVDHLRAAGLLSGRTVLGSLCVYLLIGTFFTFLYALLAAVGTEPFFTDVDAVGLADLEYFSFTTQTTVGFGDLVPATRAGRAAAMAQALIGQIYLVTVVALVVSNLTLPRAADRSLMPPEDGSSPDETQEPS